MSGAPSDVKLTLERTSSNLLQQIEALEKRTSELKRSREELEGHESNDRSREENKKGPGNDSKATFKATSMGAVAKGTSPGGLTMPFQAKGGMPNGGMPKALGMPAGMKPDGEGGEMQNQVMLQMQMQMQMMMMGAMMGSMLGEGEEGKKKKRKKDKKDDDLPPGSSSDMSHPSYRPSDMEQMPGVTDRRFEGRITMWLEDKGYGFIGNEEVKQRFNGMDVFLHLNQKRHFSQGDHVSFSIFKNYRGQPQATELREA